jgi:hypothetical protein
MDFRVNYYSKNEAPYHGCRNVVTGLLLLVRVCSPALRNHVAGVAGILGENLIIPEAITKNLMGFISVNTITFAVCLFCFVGIMAYIRWRRLL